MRNKNLFTIILLFLFSASGNAQHTSAPAFVTDSLDAYIERALVAWNIPGASVAIVKDGNILIKKGFGVTQKEGNEPVDAHTLFMIASNVKAFTGTAMATLAHEERCSLSDRVVKYLPGFRLYDSLTTTKATLGDLLTHNMGYSTFQGDFLYFYSTLKPADIYSSYALMKPPYEFRTTYGYSNIGYFFAGECISAITGMPWDQYIRKTILDPLQMNRTQLLSKGIGSQPNIAWGHTLEQGVLKKFPHTNIDLIGSAAGMSSTASDLSNWLLAQLDEGRFEGIQVIPRAVIHDTRFPRTIIGRNQHLYNHTHYDLYGLGWALEDYEGVEIVSHSGGIWGFVSGVTLVPDLNLGIVILTNSDENWFYEALKWEILDAFLGLPYRNYSDDYCSRYKRQAEVRAINLQKWQDAVTDTFPFGKKIKEFEGTWNNELYGNILIKKEQNQLKVTFEHHPGLTAVLLPMKDNAFLCTYTPSRFGTFRLPANLNDRGKVILPFRVAERLDRGVYEFEKVMAY